MSLWNTCFLLNSFRLLSQQFQRGTLWKHQKQPEMDNAVEYNTMTNVDNAGHCMDILHSDPK